MQLNTTVCLLIFTSLGFNSNVHANGRCPNENSIIDLNPTRYMGQNAESSKQDSFLFVLMKTHLKVFMVEGNL